jgi:DNA modification methylase
MLTLVSAFSDPGETVLDPVAGYATTEVAAILLGRQCVSVERDAMWADRARARIEDAVSGMFDARDIDRAKEWCAKWEAEARSVPEPKDPSQRPTWERAQRRLADVLTVKGKL